MAGFGATPGELNKAANTIDDAVKKTDGLVWQGPSGNYGHPGVQEGWGQFVEGAKSEIQKLADATKGHGESLVQCAQHYLNIDEQVAGQLGNAVGDVGSAIGKAATSVGSAVGSAGSAVGSAVNGAVSTAGSAIGHAVSGGPQLSGEILGGFSGAGASGSGIAKEAEL